jgi:hypothetical protein
VKRGLQQDVAAREARKAIRARVPDSPMPGEGRMPEQLGQRRTADGPRGERDDIDGAGGGK